ncbi:MAG: ATP-dependent helicase C-terminal domain-containing protein, partial [Phycisphaeraceae bacterium]|nr:ATP-dependent helicase C-terminal domain-containing protein [Phycisphaeraceae bacterium]
GALEGDGRLTDSGIAMAALPMHPRLGRMLVEAARRDALSPACTWAAMISEPDFVRRETAKKARGAASDLAWRAERLEEAANANFDAGRCRRLGIDVRSARQIDRTRKLYRRAADRARLTAGNNPDSVSLRRSMLAGFPDRVGRRPSATDTHVEMPGLTRVEISHGSAVDQPGLLVAADVREQTAGRQPRTLLEMVTRVEADDLMELFPDDVRVREETDWDPTHQQVVRREQLCYGELILEETARPETDREKSAAILARRIIDGELALPNWDDSVEAWLQRVAWVKEHFPDLELPDVGPDSRQEMLERLCVGAQRFADVRDRPVLETLKGELGYELQQQVKTLAPTEIRLPSGFTMPITYEPGEPPRGRAKIQDLYDQKETPRVGRGKHPVLLEILAPNFRPIQVTDDLAGFWKNLYPEVRKELRRRYSKHEWR